MLQPQSSKTIVSASNPNRADVSSAKTVVFISQSIPEMDLFRLLEQGSGKKDTVFVLRGFMNGDQEITMQFIEKIAQTFDEKKKAIPNIIVYPHAFRAYQVTHVPAVIHKNKDGQYYMAQGGLNLNAAIAAIERHQYGKPLSRQWKVAEVDQAVFLQQQASKVIKQNQDKWDSEAADLITQKIEGEMTLPYAKTTKTDVFTPYFTLPENLLNPETGKVILPKGTKLNLLGNDTGSGGTILAIDGRDLWQVNFAYQVLKKDPNAIVFYTKRGTLKDGVALPLEKGVAERLHLSVVPTLLIKKGNQFERRVYRR